jgi:hypothetical protein
MKITEGWLESLGFIPYKSICGETFFIEVGDTDQSIDDFSNIGLERGNGTDKDCWDVIFHRTYGQSFKQPDTVTLRHGLKFQSEVEHILEFFPLNTKVS